jgi:general secretion pathway protein D
MGINCATILTVSALVMSLPVRVDAQVAAVPFTTYDCRQKPADEVARILRPLLPKSPSVQLVVDRDQNRILLSGADDVQSIARRLLSEINRPVTRQPASFPPTARSNSLQPTQVDSLARFVFIPQDRFARLQQQLSAMFGNRLTVRRIGPREILQLELSQQPPSWLEIEFDQVRSGVLIGGPTSGVNQLATLAEALVDDNRGRGFHTQVFRVHRTNHGSLQQLIRPAPPTSPPPAANGYHPRGSGLPQRLHNAVAPARYLFQEQDPAPQAESAAPPANQAPNKAAPPAAQLRQFEGVEIESLPDLDVIILRGRDQDLDQLAEIIKQLERISQETQPEVRVYPLRYAQSEAVAEIVTQASSDLVSGRAGKITVTPLVKPNSLLLIGWGDAVNAVVQLIHQLDQPVAPQTQSAVFRLRYASANAAQQTLDTFFSNRNALAPRIQVTVDSRTNSLIVHAAPRDMQEVRRIIQDLDRPDSAAVNRAHIFQIENALAADVAQTLQQAIEAASGNAERSAILELQTFDAEGQRILRSGTLEHVQITPNPRNNTIIVSSPAESLQLIAALIRQLDSPADQAQIKVFQIVNGDAASLVETLRSLLPSQPGTSAGPQLSNAPGESSLAPLRFSVDVRSNSIIATGSEGDLRVVEALLIKLDQSNTMQRKTAVYQLENSPAVDVANAVNQFLVNRRQVEQAAPGAESPFQELEREVVVVPEPVANKLILAATPRYFDEISELIEKLDEQPAQVMIQVLIAEVALNDTDEFGVELGLQDSVLFDRSLLGDLLTTTSTATGAAGVIATDEIIQSATNIPGFAFNSLNPLGNSGSATSLGNAGVVGGQGLSNFAVGRGNDQLGFGGLVLSANSQNVNVLIRALQESRRVDILSRPQIRTLDNQPAFIQVGQRVPRIIGSTVNQNGQSNSVTLENVGLILGVTPRISPDGNVVMEIDAEKSQLGPEEDGIPVAVSIDGTVIRSPRIDTTTAQTTVSATDGETIVLGGLITKRTEEVHRRVPWLGDIPLVKHLFRYDGIQSRRTELLIILTPHVIRAPEDNELIRQAEMARMSWCAADVFDLQGDIGCYADTHFEMTDHGQPDTIYPDLNPSGEPTPIEDVTPAPPRVLTR